MLQSTKLLLLTVLFAVIGGNHLMAHLIGPPIGHTANRTSAILPIRLDDGTVVSTTSPKPKTTVVSTTSPKPKTTVVSTTSPKPKTTVVSTTSPKPKTTVVSTTSSKPKTTVVSTTTEAPNAYNHPKFHFGPKQLSWFRAYDYCKERKWQLIVLDTNKIRLEFESYLTKYKLRDKRIWTAGNQLTDMKTWRWGLDGPKITYTHWAKKQPDNYKHQQHCIKLFQRSLEWDDDSCEKVYNFACLKN